MPRKPKPKQKRGLAGNLMAAAIFLMMYLVLAAIFESIVYVAYIGGYLGYNNFNFLSDVVTLIPLSIAVFVYLFLYNKETFAKSIKSLGFTANGGIFKLIGLGLVIFMIIIIFEIVVGVISTAINMPINTNVDTVLAGAPLWFYVFSAVIEPINEEILFRGFLVPRIGILVSSLIFGLAHYSYYSTFGVEVIAAFMFGTLAGYVFRKTKSIYPGMIAHILINSIAVLALIG